MTDDSIRPAPYHHGDLRAALLAAAETVLAEHGIEGFTLRECARRAGVSHAAPAHHFGDVRGLLTEMARIGFERLRDAMLGEITASAEDPAARLAAAGRGYVAFARQNPQHFLLIFQSHRLDKSDRALAAAGAASFGVLVDAIRALRRVEQPLADPAARLDLVMTWSMVHGLATLALTGKLDPFDPTGGDMIGPLAVDRWTRMLALATPEQLSASTTSASN